jgi:hypothetical protein
MVFLLDVNLLLVVVRRNGFHGFMGYLSDDPIRIRGISSNPKFTPDALTPVDAILLLERIVVQPGHVFWPDDLAMTQSVHFPRKALKGFRQTTDAYLFALSLSRGGKLATLDQGVIGLAATPKERESLIIVVDS